jgi:hypothetical protein
MRPRVHMASPSSGGTMIGGPCGTGTSSSSNGTVTAGPYGTRTSSSSDGNAALTGYDNESSSSPTCMRFALGTSSSPMCVTPNSSFIISNIFYKHRNRPKSYTNSLILKRVVSAFFEKKKMGEELTNWHGGTGPSCRRRLDSPDGYMARI